MRHLLLSDLICMHVMDTLLVSADVKGTGHPKNLTSFACPYSMLFQLQIGFLLSVFYLFAFIHFVF